MSLAVAPMMGYTDRHARYLFRLLDPEVILYTEMITTQALLHAGSKKMLGYDPRELPLVLQLGGSDPDALSECTKMAEDAGFSEVNLNVGCPSPRVAKGKMGACLMKEPELVARCVEAMRGTIPVSVKCRLGVDDRDDNAFLEDFATKVFEAGCDRLIVHARKAYLKGLSPKKNRTVPPLRYESVYRLKSLFPEKNIWINGGIADLASAQAMLDRVDGAMVGRAYYRDPKRFLVSYTSSFLDEVAARYLDYVDAMEVAGFSRALMLRHLHTIATDTKRAKTWRKLLCEKPFDRKPLEGFFSQTSDGRL